MLDLAKHIVNQKSGRFEPEKFEDHYEAALVDLINSKRAGKPITAKARPRGENVVDLMEALRRSVGAAEPAKASKEPRKAAAGQGRQEGGQRGGREEDGVETAAQVGLATPKDPGPTFFQTARREC